MKLPAGWRYIGEEPYFFEHYERQHPFAQVMYDYGGWEHPRGEELTQENVDEWVLVYPAGYYWSATRDDLHGGPYRTLMGAIAAADAAVQQAVLA